jgi:hypothetical protein
VLDAVGTAMVRAVALAVDKAFFVGAGNKEPVGLLTLGLPSTVGAVDYAGLVSAAGAIRAACGKPDEHVLFGSDGTQARVIARADVGVNDINGLNVIKASAGRSSKAA